MGIQVGVRSQVELADNVKQLYDAFGQRKPMGEGSHDPLIPHYFLHRTFLGEHDLLIIFNTKRCKYQCYFCQLPAKSSRSFIPAEDIIAQFAYVMDEMKHSLSVLDRLTFSNEGSILDPETFPTSALLAIAEAVREVRVVRTLVLETRLEFVDAAVIQAVRALLPRVDLHILTGFETHDAVLRDRVLFKREPLSQFEAGLDAVAASGCSLNAYILYKPGTDMTDAEAYVEAEASIDYLVAECMRRQIPLRAIRLNPMYAAAGSRWAKTAHASAGYQPPRLTDIMRLAAKKRQAGVPIYIGLSTEGLDDGSSYMVREDYAPQLIRPVKLFNDEKLADFEGIL